MFHSDTEFQAAIGEPALTRGKRLAHRVLARVPGGLRDVRTALSVSQQRLAEQMAITQAEVSRIENREDMHLSTLRSYVEALGGSLELIVRFPDRAFELTALESPSHRTDSLGA